MSNESLETVVELLDTSLEAIEDETARHDVREAQQLVLGYLEVGRDEAGERAD